MNRCMIRMVLSVLALCAASNIVFGQGSKQRRPRHKSSTRQTNEKPVKVIDELKRDYPVRTGRYYLAQVTYHETSGKLAYYYVVEFDASTPAGHSAIDQAATLMEHLGPNRDLRYTIAALSYLCLIDLKELTTHYVRVMWLDRNANELAHVETSLSGNETVAVTDEYLHNSESYMTEVIDAVAKNIQAQKRLFDAQLRLRIDTGQTDTAKSMKFTMAQGNKMVPLTMFLSGDSSQVSTMSAAALRQYNNGMAQVLK